MRSIHNNWFQKEIACTANTQVSGLGGFTKYWFEVSAACTLTIYTRYGSEAPETLAAGAVWVYDGPCQGFAVSVNSNVFVTAS